MSSFVGRFASALTRDRFAQNVAILGGGTALAQALLILASPILTRVYSPRDMGLMGLYVAYVGFATVAVSLRYDTAIVSATDRNEAAHLVFVSLAFLLPSSLVFAGVFYGMVRFATLGFGQLPAYTMFFVIPFVLFTGAFGALRYWFIREESLQNVSTALVTQNGARSLLQVIFGGLGMGWIGLVGGDLLGRSVGMGGMLRSAWPEVTKEVFPIRARKIVQVLTAYRRFPIYSLPSALIDALALSIPLPLIANLYGTDSAGHFSLVLRVLSLPLALVGTSVADSFHGRLAAHVREEPGNISGFFYRTARGLFLVGVGPAILLVMFGEPLFRLVFGQGWATAGRLASAIAPWTLTQLIVSPLSRAVYVLQGQELKLAYDLVSLSLTMSSIYIGHARGFSLFQTILWLSVMNIIANGLYFVLLRRIVVSRIWPS